MESSAPPITPQTWKRVMKQEGEPVLTLTLRRPAVPEGGRTGRLERYFTQMAEQWKNRWETTLFPRACQALADAREASRPFEPWQAELDYTVTLWRPPLLSLRLDVTESNGTPRPLCLRAGETWDCSTGDPRTLRSFFPAKERHWRKQLLATLQAQAAERLASGESLLDPDCAGVMERAFDPERFYLTEEGLAVFYPLDVLGPYVEGTPVFTMAMELQQENRSPE